MISPLLRLIVMISKLARYERLGQDGGKMGYNPTPNPPPTYPGGLTEEDALIAAIQLGGGRAALGADVLAPPLGTANRSSLASSGRLIGGLAPLRPPKGPGILHR